MMARRHMLTESAHPLPVFISYIAFALAVIFVFAGCKGGGSSSGAITIAIVPTTTINVDASQVVPLTATVVNDTTNAGVTWLVFNDSSTNPPTCTFVDCGTISNATPFSATYTAPASIPAQETVMIEATSVANTSITKTLSVNLVVSMMFTTMTLPGGENGVPYNQKIVVTGGVTPLVFTVSSGSLPAGLSLGTNGVIAGTPSGSGTSQFTVQVADGATPPLTSNATIQHHHRTVSADFDRHYRAAAGIGGRAVQRFHQLKWWNSAAHVEPVAGNVACWIDAYDDYHDNGQPADRDDAWPNFRDAFESRHIEFHH